MFEFILAPILVARRATVVQPADLPTRGMAGAATEFLMEAVEGPACHVVRKGWFLLCIMTCTALVLQVTIITGGMHNDHGLAGIHFGFGIQLMTIRTVFLLVAVHTGQTIHVHMLIVMEGNNGAVLVRRIVNLFPRCVDGWMLDADDISRIAGDIH